MERNGENLDYYRELQSRVEKEVSEARPEKRKRG